MNFQALMAETLNKRSRKETAELEKTIDNQAERDASPATTKRFKHSRTKPKAKARTKRKRKSCSVGTPLFGTSQARAAFPVPSAPIKPKTLIRTVDADNIRPYKNGKLFTADSEDGKVKINVSGCVLEATAIFQLDQDDKIVFRLYHCVERPGDVPSGAFSTATFSK